MGVPWKSIRQRSPENGQPRAGRTARILICVLAALAAAAFAAVIIHAHGSSRELAATAQASSGPLIRTRLTALPHHTVSDATAPLRVRLSAAPSPTSPRPVLNPAVAGTWTTAGDSEYFTPASTLKPCSTYTLTVWANTTARGHTRLGRRRSVALQVPCPPVTALQQALARLGYLGARFHSHYGVHLASGPISRRLAAHRAYRPPRGRLDPDPSDAPPVHSGELDQTTTGALIVFQEDHEIQPTGVPEGKTWSSLLAAETLDRRNREPYTWVSVSESIPETLEVHRGHHVALSTPANTGVPGAETPQGVFPIFSRLSSTTMSGTDVDGTKYVVPDVPWVNYFNGGDAVHGYPRASYGSPQSNGCVELPIETAHKVFGMLAIGDIVQVT
ncbi:MAG TPA: L,D-transpeptidase [Solirubrobacteraceae bacterium]